MRFCAAAPFIIHSKGTVLLRIMERILTDTRKSYLSKLNVQILHGDMLKVDTSHEPLHFNICSTPRIDSF